MESSVKLKPFKFQNSERYGLCRMSRFPRRIACLIALLIVFITMLVYQDTASNMRNFTNHTMATIYEGWTVNLPSYSDIAGNDSSQSNNIQDRLLDGLLSPNFDEKSCLSKYQSTLYRKPSPFKPSPYLVSKLQSYEERHRRCGPNTKSYTKSVELLKSGQVDIDDKCKYVVWLPSSGLGNRLMTLVGSFLYALLTDRVLLINQAQDMADLLCEPIPDSSWILPSGFPIKDEFEDFRWGPHTYGNMLRNNMINASTESPPYIYIYLNQDSSHLDKLFFCDDYQPFLKNVPWLMLESNLYFVPSMFLMDSFEEELTKLFPDKETVFHHLGRYLLHPSNTVWEIISDYYRNYLAQAGERIGMQIRVFNSRKTPFRATMDQILSCVQKEKLLPEVEMTKNLSKTSTTRVSKAVLITSLYGDYYEEMKRIYVERKLKNGEVVGVYQPSHEEKQRFGNNHHNIQAWAEMNLLSYSDVLVTSARSTFGYVAQGLGGKKPYILYRIVENSTTSPEQACGQAMSMEPCFHAPPKWDCKRKTKGNIGFIAPHVRVCEDTSLGVNTGVKLFNTFQ